MYAGANVLDNLDADIRNIEDITKFKRLKQFLMLDNLLEVSVRLDNTGARVIEVYPSLLCNQMSEHVDLYIKLKLRSFSFI